MSERLSGIPNPEDKNPNKDLKKKKLIEQRKTYKTKAIKPRGHGPMIEAKPKDWINQIYNDKGDQRSSGIDLREKGEMPHKLISKN